MKSSHIKNFFSEVISIAEKINKSEIQKLAENINNVRKKKGRLFFLGVGGSAGNCSHAVNDFRKLCNLESYSPTDNVSELTARINDEGWDSSFSEWLKVSNLKKKDALFIMSVGGGNLKKKVSVNLVNAIKYAKIKKSKVFGIVGKDNGYTRLHADVSVLVPNVNNKLITPHSEAFQAVIWHCLVSHPLLQTRKTKW
jgi:D-sedoheptulose 7-phosphate isomerase|tara:strand:+ start:36 stop:626 length:591 start_codon:yes stop_codon:yes gene_type:complete